MYQKDRIDIEKKKALRRNDKLRKYIRDVMKKITVINFIIFLYFLLVR